MPIVWTVLLCTPRRPRVFTEIGTSLHIDWVLEYYLSYACVMLLLCELTEMLNVMVVYCELWCELRCVGKWRRWQVFIFLILLYSIKMIIYVAFTIFPNLATHFLLFVFGLIAILSRWSRRGWVSSRWRRGLALLRGIVALVDIWRQGFRFRLGFVYSMIWMYFI